MKFESQDTVCMKAALEAENRVIEQRVCWVRLLMGIEVFLGGAGGGVWVLDRGCWPVMV